MRCKGQITLFISLGLVIFLILGLMLTLGRKEQSTSSVVISESSVRQYVEQCLKDQGLLALTITGLQGGHMYKSEFPGFIDANGVPVHYHYYVGTNVVPYRDDIEELQLERYFDTSFTECIDNFLPFGPGVQSGGVKSDATINDDNVVIRLDYPVYITNNDGQRTINDFSHTFSVPLGFMLDASTILVNQLIKDPNYVNMELLNSLPFYTTVLPLEGSKSLYIMQDPVTNYTFMFGALHTFNSKPDLLAVGTQILTFNSPFLLQLEALEFDSEEVVFSDNTNMFDIDPKTGVIDFVPKNLGKFEVKITATDPKGNQDVEILRLEVVR